MVARFHKKILAVCAGCVLSAQVFAGGTNLILTAETTNTATENALLQIQAELHDTQLSLQSSRQSEAQAAADFAAMTARLQSLEQAVAAQQAAEIERARKSEQLTLAMIGGFGLAGLGILLLMIYFQWRAFTQLAEISARQILALGNQRALPDLEAVHVLAGPGRATVESSNTQLLAAVDRLEKRLLELEQGARAPLAEINAPKTDNHKNGNSTDSDREECVANLIAEGQALLDANEAEKALECFEVALNLYPKHAETLVKKGGALEKLGRTDEAIACYDQAIEADDTLTIAYLHKGGLFNRIARYDEALQCYERALHTQDKKSAAGKAA